MVPKYPASSGKPNRENRMSDTGVRRVIRISKEAKLGQETLSRKKKKGREKKGVSRTAVFQRTKVSKREEEKDVGEKNANACERFTPESGWPAVGKKTKKKEGSRGKKTTTKRLTVGEGLKEKKDCKKSSE